MGRPRKVPAGSGWVPKWIRYPRPSRDLNNPPRPRIGGESMAIRMGSELKRIDELAKRQVLTRTEICRRCVSLVFDEGDFGLDPSPGPVGKTIAVVFPPDDYEMIKTLAAQVDRPISVVARALIVQGLERYEASQLSPVA